MNMSTASVVEERRCGSCKRLFIPSSRHKCCPVCRTNHRKKPCTDCGKLCNSRHTGLCVACNNKARGRRDGTIEFETVRQDGDYLALAVPFDHPGGTKGWMLQHRYLMQKHLGRALLPGETVHHKNGLKTDNRLSNLELWVTHQPSGQRPEDLLEWADEIIRRYRK